MGYRFGSVHFITLVYNRLMKHFTKLLAVLVACTIGAGAYAWEAIDAVQSVDQGGTPLTATMASAIDQPVKAGTFEIPAAATTAKPNMHRSGAKKAVSSISDLLGKRVMSYSTLITSLGSGGGTVTITQGTGDTIVINDWFAANVVVKAAVDLTNKTITIPNQVIVNNANYGDVDIVTITSSGSIDRTTPLTGTIDDDGNISIDSWWGAAIVSGTYKDYFMAGGYETTLEVPNGTMVVNRYDTTIVYNWSVIVEQTGKNLVTVKNFGNHGKTVEVVLKSTGVATVNSQTTWEAGSTQGEFKTYAADWSSGKLTNTTMTGTATSEAITFGNWTNYSSNNYYTGKYADATIKGITFTLPTSSVTSLSGSGTESDPFRIRTLDDLVYLSESVNSSTDMTYGGPTYFYSKSYIGKYFVIENDIDMSNYRFEPIGKGYYYRFAGIIDGQNHTLTGLDVSTGSNGYAGLFGYCDSVSVIKNIKLASADVETEYYYAGGIAAMSYGSIENCTVDGTITNSGVGCGGIVAVGNNVSGCAFSGQVNGTGGITGGVAGQIYGTLTGCNAQGYVNVSGVAETYTGGGVVGTMYGPNSKCLNSYFTGTVNGSNHSNLYVGGVVGQNYKGVIDGCFSLANIYGYDTKACVGGVVGVLNGELYNSYSTGYIQSVGSKYSGGITGTVSYYTSNGDTIQSTVKNCYFAGRLRAENYLYDKETEVRETFGTLATGAKPTVENVFFDLQMVDYTSTQYRTLTSTLTSASGPGFPSDVWTFTEGYYPRITAIADNDAAKLSASVLALDEAFPDNTSYVSSDADIKLLGNTKAYILKNNKLVTTGYCGSISNNKYVLNQTFGSDTIVFYNPSNTNVTPRYILLTVSPKFFPGNGKEDDPFQIKTKADVMLLGELTTTLDQHFNNVYFKQMNDIDMESDTSFLGLACSVTNAASNRFGGTYDGGGHTLHNVWLYYMGWSKKPTDTSLGTPNSKDPKCSIYKGFVGSLDINGVVKNLTMASDCQFDFWGYAGAIVGYNYGTVDNCKNYGTVRCYSTTGAGIVGNNTPTGVIKNCLNAGNIYGGWTTYGGIVGSSSGTIENCMNVGTIVAKQMSTFQSAASKFKIVGGIAGRVGGSVIRNVVNAGHTEAAGGSVAGLFGSYNSTATKSEYYAGGNDTYCALNYGTVFTGDLATTGCIGGNGYSSNAVIENVYYDQQATGLSAAANGAMPGSEAVMTDSLISGKPLAGFDTDVWTFAAGKYPVLTQFADVDIVKSAIATYVNTTGIETTSTLTQDATLSNATWSLANGTKFSVSGTTLKVPETTSETVRDTLNVTNGDFVTAYALAAVMPNPLAGSGTEADPFQIVDPYTWDAFAHYMAATGSTFAGQYVKVMNDINFADTTFVPFGYDGVTGFGGILFSDSATVSGITYKTTAKEQGAICELLYGGEVRDLTLAGTITSTYASTGGFFGKMYGTATNCVNNIEVNATAATVGGFAAVTGNSSYFKNCVNNAAITGSKGTIGGFVGSGVTGLKFEDCVNNGTITNSGAASAKNTAGFVASGYGTYFNNCVNNGTVVSNTGSLTAGLQANALGSDTIWFLNCENTAAITGGSSVAGLLGTTATKVPAAHIYADNCTNSGAITSNLKASYGTAGLFGMLSAGSKVLNCSNTADINATQTVYNGGLWGYHVSGTAESDSVVVTSCYNTGKVTAGGNYAAGLGTTPRFSHITDCYNLGEISANLAAGGLVNIPGHDVYIDNCYNAGNVTTVKNGAGGLIGYGSVRSYASNSFNTGTVTAGTQNAGGFEGQGRTVFTNCYNRGDVYGPKNVGGLVGMCYAGGAAYTATSFYQCYNAGNPHLTDAATDTLVGNLVGATKSWDPANGCEVVETYYVTDYYGKTYDTDSIGGTATTVKELAASENLPGNWSYGDEYTYPIIKGMEENLCAKTFAVAVVLYDGDTYENVTGRFYMGEQDNVTWTSSTDSIYINDYAFIGGPVDKMFTPVTMTAVSDDGLFQAPWYLQMNAETGLDEKQLADRQLIGSRYFNITGAEVSEPQKGNIYIRIDEYNDGSQSAVKVRR